MINKKIIFEDKTVRLKFDIYNPQNYKNSSVGYILIPGFMSTPDAHSSLSQNLANESKKTVLNIIPKLETYTKNPQMYEGKALAALIKNLDLQDLQIHLIGVSNGAIQALYAVNFNEKVFKDITLVSPVGLKESTVEDLKDNFSQNAKLTKAEINKADEKNRKELLIINKRDQNTFNRELRKEIIKHPLNFLGRINAALTEMASHQKEVMEGIKVPVHVIGGSKDIVMGENSPKNIQLLFPNSHEVKVTLLDEIGVHGISLLRPELIAKKIVNRD